MIEVKNLTIGYDNNRVVQRDLNFTVNKGEIFVILGGSGCGKSTLLKHMIGLIKPFSGDIIIKGNNIATANIKDKRSMMHEFGVLYQSGALFGGMTLGENVGLLLDEFTDYSKAEKDEIIDQKLSLVDLKEFRNYYPAEVSGGMKKRAGLARAMALSPELLFFDEPSAGLDPISSANLDQLILSVREKFNTTIVIVTHELDSIFTVADRVIVLDAETKTMIEMGNPHELRKNSQNAWVKKFLNRCGQKHI